VGYDVLLRGQEGGLVPLEIVGSQGQARWQRGLAECLQQMGCTHLLQSYWQGIPQQVDNSGAPPTLTPRMTVSLPSEASSVFKSRRMVLQVHLCCLSS